MTQKLESWGKGEKKLPWWPEMENKGRENPW